MVDVMMEAWMNMAARVFAIDFSMFLRTRL